MIKSFLSHSSKDKKSYVEIVAKKLGTNNCVYDAFTFEEGMQPLDEIVKRIGESKLFVIFISESALQSEWVNIEITNAKKELDRKNINRIFPIIIDENIQYSDKRIPQWLRDEYNLKYVSRPVVAARRILQRLREISWNSHPNLKEKRKIFVGRNTLINSFEERIDDFAKVNPSCIIASGLQSIGRRSLLEHCITKTNICDESYIPSYIYLNSQDSIEDLIVKLFDLGFSKNRDLSNLLKTSVQDKVKIAIDIVNDIQKSKEILFIIDNGCIITYKRQICSWFIDILGAINVVEKLTFCIIAKFRPAYEDIRNQDHTFLIEVPELNVKERNGLLKRYSEYEGLDLTKDDFNYFSNLLSGYPEQIFFTVHQIKDTNLVEAKSNSHLIVEYNSLKTQHLLSKWENNDQAMSFLRLLSEFEIISYELAFEIVGEDKIFKDLINEYRASSLIEFVGANKEYIRVSDNVRDYIRRQKLKIKTDYKDKLSNHVNGFLKTYESNDTDLSDFLYSMKASLKSGKRINEKYLLPSHFLKTIKELYDQDRKYNEVVELADRVLINDKNLEQNIILNIRYYLCLSLARLRNSRCVKEAFAFKGAEHNFILGFYYRLKGRYDESINKLNEALRQHPDFARARRELVIVLQYIDEYGQAYELAKQNYENEKTNPYHIQAYLNCLLKKNESGTNELIESLLLHLEAIKSETAHEMYLTGKAEYLAFKQNNELLSIELIDEAIELFPDVFYPKLMKLDILLKFDKINKVKSLLEQIESEIEKSSYFYNSLIRRKCLYIAKTDGYDSAQELAIKHMATYTDKAKDKYLNLLKTYANR